MTEPGIVEATILGIAGGALPELFAMWKLRHASRDDRPDWLRSGYYWVITVIMLLLGGFFVWLYMKSGTNISRFMSVHIGASTPLILGTLIEKQPEINQA